MQLRWREGVYGVDASAGLKKSFPVWQTMWMVRIGSESDIYLKISGKLSCGGGIRSVIKCGAWTIYI